MISKLSWGSPAICVNNDGRPARFKVNTLCFVCAYRAEQKEVARMAEMSRREAEKKAALAKLEAKEEFYDELGDELLDEVDRDLRIRY